MKDYQLNDGLCRIYEKRQRRDQVNYLWSERGYCAQVSQVGRGRSYYLNERAEMCSLNCDGARYLFLRDDEANDSWCVGGAPLSAEVENYCCVHALAYTKISSLHGGISAGWRLFVPVEGYGEIWTLTLENTSEKVRRLSVFPALSFELEGFSYPRYYEMYRCLETIFDDALNGVYCSSRHPFAPHRRYNAYLTSSEPVFAYDGDLAAFCGPLNIIARPDGFGSAVFSAPEVLIGGRDCTNSEAAQFVLGAVLQNKIELAPHERKTLHFAAGVAENLEEARFVRGRLHDREVEQAFAGTVLHTEEKYASLSAKTPDEKINAVMNGWLKKQVDFCLVGKKGVRDNLQIAVAMLSFRPERAKAEILECLCHQFRDGHAVLTWYPYDDTRYSDQPFWIVWAVCELVKETGDLSLLQNVLPYQDGGEGSVFGHAKAAAERLLADRGKDGLVKIFFADWNDALNVTTDPEAQSVMLSHQTALALAELAVLSDRIGEREYAAHLLKERAALAAAINKRAWDHDHYVRVCSEKGDIGAHSSRGSKIYLNAQTWAVLADVVPEEKISALLAAVDGMESEFGFPLNAPPYTEYLPEVGRMSGMLAGEYENGGVYCHATGFKIVMDCKLGRAEEAVRTLKKIMPDSEHNPSSRSGAEPYVFTNCYSTHPKYYGRSYMSWTTGTSAWAMMCLYEGILGLKRSYEGLILAPCFPSGWKEGEAVRIFRGAEYHIVYKRTGEKGIVADGRRIEGGLLPVFADGMRHEIECTF